MSTQAPNSPSSRSNEQWDAVAVLEQRDKSPELAADMAGGNAFWPIDAQNFDNVDSCLTIPELWFP